MPKHIVSLDFDHCVFNPEYMEAVTAKTFESENIPLLATNQSLFADILANTEAVDAVTLMVGSNRQSHRVDGLNSFKWGVRRTTSCYSALIEVCIELNKLHAADQKDLPRKFTVDPFLLADLYNDKEAGYSFNFSIANSVISTEAKERVIHPDIIFDYSKITLLYAQIHKIASAHAAEEKIIFDFIDDSWIIRRELHDFFKVHLDLIPANVTFNIFDYPPRLRKENHLTGTGPIDFQYQNNIKKLAVMTGFELHTARSQREGMNLYHIMGAIAAFKKGRETAKPVVTPVVSHSTNSQGFFAGEPARSASVDNNAVECKEEELQTALGI